MLNLTARAWDYDSLHEHFSATLRQAFDMLDESEAIDNPNSRREMEDTARALIDVYQECVDTCYDRDVLVNHLQYMRFKKDVSEMSPLYARVSHDILDKLLRVHS